MSNEFHAASTEVEHGEAEPKNVKHVSMHFHAPVTTQNLHAGAGDIQASEVSPSRKTVLFDTLFLGCALSNFKIL